MQVQRKFKNFVERTKYKKKFHLTYCSQNFRKTLCGDSKKKSFNNLGPYCGKNDPF